MNLRTILSVLLAFHLGVTLSVYADTFFLKDGTKIKGAVLRESRNEVEVISDIGIFRFLKSDLSKTEKGSIWENNSFLKKANQYNRSPSKIPVVKREKGKLPPIAEKVRVSKPALSLKEVAFREKEFQLRQQEVELKRIQLEMMREELDLKKQEIEASIAATRVMEAELDRKEALEGIPGEEAASEEVFIPLIEEQALEEPPLSKEEIREMVLEEQNRARERKEQLESYRRLQEVRQKQEGITIRGRINPAGKETYTTY